MNDTKLAQLRREGWRFEVEDNCVVMKNRNKTLLVAELYVSDGELGNEILETIERALNGEEVRV